LVQSDVRTSCEFHCQGSYISPIIIIRKPMLNSKSIKKHSSEHSYFHHEKKKRRNVCIPKHRNALETVHPGPFSDASRVSSNEVTVSIAVHNIVVVGLERGPLSLVRSIEELLE